MKRHSLIALAVTCAAAAAPLAAQDSAHPHRHQPPGEGRRPDHMAAMHEMMAPMMRAMAFTPQRLLERKDDLGLTPTQITRLTALHDAAHAAHQAAQAEAGAHRDALVRVLTAASPDTASLRQHFQAAHDAMGKGHLAMLRAAAQARSLLTEGQRGRVEAWADAMEMRH
jgi:hypothetical protein